MRAHKQTNEEVVTLGALPACHGMECMAGGTWWLLSPRIVLIRSAAATGQHGVPSWERRGTMIRSVSPFGGEQESDSHGDQKAGTMFVLRRPSRESGQKAAGLGRRWPTWVRDGAGSCCHDTIRVRAEQV